MKNNANSWAKFAAVIGNPELTYAEIAKKLKISIATVCVWTKSLSLPPRRRGRRRQIEPSVRNQALLLTARTTSPGRAAAQFKISKQRVSKLMRRWEGWLPDRAAKEARITQNAQEIPC